MLNNINTPFQMTPTNTVLAKLQKTIISASVIFEQSVMIFLDYNVKQKFASASCNYPRPLKNVWSLASKEDMQVQRMADNVVSWFILLDLVKVFQRVSALLSDCFS